MTGTKVWLFDWFRFPPPRVLLESTRYSTIPEESRKACNRPAQYGFVRLSEHVVYPPLCGSKFKTLDFKANNRKPWHPRLCLRKSSKAALSLGCGKAGEGQEWTKHTRTVFEKIQQPIFEWAFCLGLSWAGAAQCGFVARSYLLDAETSRLSSVPAIVVDQHEQMGDCPRFLYCEKDEI